MRAVNAKGLYTKKLEEIYPNPNPNPEGLYTKKLEEICKNFARVRQEWNSG